MARRLWDVAVAVGAASIIICVAGLTLAYLVWLVVLPVRVLLGVA